jgi:hypothetical protein
VARTFNIRIQFAAAGVLAAVVMLFAAGHAQAASYPSGGSTFTGNAEGWSVNGACVPINIPLVCEGSAEYNGTVGNPAGSLRGTQSVLLSALGLLNTSFTAESPVFVAKETGVGTLKLERSLDNSALLSLSPTLAYTATLVDKTGGSEQKALEESTGVTGFGAKEAAVSLVDGHHYAIKIAATTSSNVAGVGLTGKIFTGFDNIAVVDPAGPNSNNGNDGNNGNNGSNGQNGVTSAELRQIMQSSLVGPAVLRGNKILAKAKCPAKVGRACKITLVGHLTRRKVATARRVGTVAKGKKRPLPLRVKKNAKAKVKKSRTLLFKETVQAGKAHATVWKRLRLVKR